MPWITLIRGDCHKGYAGTAVEISVLVKENEKLLQRLTELEGEVRNRIR